MACRLTAGVKHQGHMWGLESMVRWGPRIGTAPRLQPTLTMSWQLWHVPYCMLWLASAHTNLWITIGTSMNEREKRFQQHGSTLHDACRLQPGPRQAPYASRVGAPSATCNASSVIEPLTAGAVYLSCPMASARLAACLWAIQMLAGDHIPVADTLPAGTMAAYRSCLSGQRFTSCWLLVVMRRTA